MEEQSPSESSERLLALQELRTIGAISESDYARETGSTKSEAAEAPPTSQAAARRRLSFIRRFLRREQQDVRGL
jgi:hypothetical protein